MLLDSVQRIANLSRTTRSRTRISTTKGIFLNNRSTSFVSGLSNENDILCHEASCSHRDGLVRLSSASKCWTDGGTSTEPFHDLRLLVSVASWYGLPHWMPVIAVASRAVNKSLFSHCLRNFHSHFASFLEWLLCLQARSIRTAVEL